MTHLDAACPKNKREHDITAFKRLEANTLQMKEPKGRKVILAYDPAIYDFGQWKRWKPVERDLHHKPDEGNSRLQICGDREFDQEDPRNVGIVRTRWEKLTVVTCCARSSTLNQLLAESMYF